MLISMRFGRSATGTAPSITWYRRTGPWNWPSSTSSRDGGEVLARCGQSIGGEADFPLDRNPARYSGFPSAAMKTSKLIFLAGLGAAIALCQADAQQQKRKLPGAGTSPIKVGSKLADVTAFTSGGEEFPLRQKLKGRHAVIVFGCLT